MNGPDSISDPVARRIRYTGSCPSARGSARRTRLDLARLAADDVAGGSHCADVSADWSLTWHATCACWHHNYIMLMPSCHAYCACWHHNYVMQTSLISGSVTWVGSAHPGEKDAWGPSARVGRRPAGEWWRVRPCPTSDFDAVFTNGFVSSSSTQWYGQNIILWNLRVKTSRTSLRAP